MVQVTHRPGQLIEQNGDKNVAQALSQLHILIVGGEAMHVMHDSNGLPEFSAQGNPGGMQLFLLTCISMLMLGTQVV